MDIPSVQKMEDRPYNQYGQCLYTEDRWDQLCAWLTGNPTFRRQLAGYKQALRDQMGCSQEDSDPRNKARVPSLLQEREAPRLQRGLPVTSGLPHRSRLMGGGSRAVSSRSLRTQLPPPSNLNSFMRWVATLLLVV